MPEYSGSAALSSPRPRLEAPGVPPPLPSSRPLARRPSQGEVPIHITKISADTFRDAVGFVASTVAGRQAKGPRLEKRRREALRQGNVPEELAGINWLSASLWPARSGKMS